MWYLKCFFFLLIYIFTRPLRKFRAYIHVTRGKRFQKIVTFLAFPILFLFFPVVFRTGDITTGVMAVESVILLAIYHIAGGLKGDVAELAKWMLSPFMIMNIWSYHAMDYFMEPAGSLDLIHWIMYEGKSRKKCPKVNRVKFL